MKNEDKDGLVLPNKFKGLFMKNEDKDGLVLPNKFEGLFYEE